VPSCWRHFPAFAALVVRLAAALAILVLILELRFLSRLLITLPGPAGASPDSAQHDK